MPTADDLSMGRQYRAVLRQYADGDHQGALRALREFEHRFVGQQDASRQSDLWRVQAVVVRDLMQREPEILLPVMLLHHDAAALYQREQIWHQAGRSRRLTGVLALEYTRQVDTQGARVTAARVLASLGGYLQEIMSSEACRCVPFYREALRLDDTNIAALLGLATAYEKAGAYLDAALELEALLKIKPEFREARLRLALNELRLGNERKARGMLRDLVAEERDWLSLLAFQELVAHWVAEERFQDAAETAVQARERFPEDQALLVQQALIRERQEHAGVATSQLAELRRRPRAEARRGAVGRLSPRMRYNRTPLEVFGADRRQLREEAAGRLVLLAELVPPLPETAPEESAVATASPRGTEPTASEIAGRRVLPLLQSSPSLEETRKSLEIPRRDALAGSPAFDSGGEKAEGATVEETTEDKP